MSSETLARSHSAPMLRRLRTEDAEAVLAAFNSNADMALQGDVANLDQAKRYVARLTAADSPHEPWAVVQGDTFAGLVWMADHARGRGWMSRAAATVADWALTKRALERLELGHRVNNPASEVVARRAGFVKEGTEREKFLIDGQRIDVYTYGRLRADPSPVFEPLEMKDGQPYL